MKDAIELFSTKLPSTFSSAVEAADFDGLASSLEPAHWTTLPQAFAECRAVVKPLLNEMQLTKAVQSVAQEFLMEHGPGVLAIMACVQAIQGELEQTHNNREARLSRQRRIII